MDEERQHDCGADRSRVGLQNITPVIRPYAIFRKYAQRAFLFLDLAETVLGLALDLPETWLRLVLDLPETRPERC